MCIHWATGLQQGRAEAAQDLKRCGYQVSVTTGNKNDSRDVEERLNKLFPWKTTTSYSTAQRARERLMEFNKVSLMCMPPTTPHYLLKLKKLKIL